MKLTVQVKLQPTPEQAVALLRTLELANAAANRLSQPGICCPSGVESDLVRRSTRAWTLRTASRQAELGEST